MNKHQYYDKIAKDYDSFMYMDTTNGPARKKIKNYFESVVPEQSKVLDFGGGTGEDLYWLTKRYDVTFIEPSVKMKEIAVSKTKKYNYNVYFADSISNEFENFTEQTFKYKFEGLIANFAVINSIQNLQLLSEKLNLICASNSNIIFVVLYRYPSLNASFLERFLFNTKFKLFSFKKEININHDSLKNTVHIHSLPIIKKYFKKDFKIINHFVLKNSYFQVIHLKKK